MLRSIELEDWTTKKNKLWFDEQGQVWYGKDENNLMSAEGVELSSGYKAFRLYIADLKRAFLLGKQIGEKKEDDF